MAKRLLGLVAAFILAAGLPAQKLLSGITEIQFELDRLSSTGSVLMIGAHPDDEDNALLAWFARGLKWRTAYLSLTRGEGGQNLIGPEQGALLGIIRSAESHAAGRIDGAQRFFTTAVDFGYSKSAEEAMHIWSRQKVLGEIVRLIRAFRPKLVLLRFSGTPSDGHGQHQASAILGREAFRLAADPLSFPEMGPPWRSARLLQVSSKQGIRIELGRFDPALGYSHTDIGALSRSQHRSQGMGVSPERGAEAAYLTGDTSGLDTQPARGPRFDSPDLLQKLRALRPGRPQQVDEMIALQNGLWFDARIDRREYTAGEQVPLTLEAISRSGVKVTSVEATAGPSKIALPPLRPLQPSRRTVSLPAGLREVVFRAVLADGEIEVRRPIVYRYADRALGERTSAPSVLPPVTLGFEAPIFLFTADAPRLVHVLLRASVSGTAGVVTLRIPSGWKVEPREQPFRMKRAGEVLRLPFRITPPHEYARAAIQAEARAGSNTFGLERIVIDYSHIPVQTVLLPASATLVRANVESRSKRIGYLEGAGDRVAESLRQIGLQVTVLEPALLRSLDLSRFDAVVLGVRALNVSPELASLRSRLLAYVEAGGVLVVQYNTSRSGRYDLPLAPYPLRLGTGRVSVETAPLIPLLPDHTIWTTPNRITAADLEGWVQERGLYFASEWDSRYDAVVSSHDPGEKPLEGALLYTRYGKGAFVYTGLSFFRQLPAGVPGAFRLFANILSAGKTDATAGP